MCQWVSCGVKMQINPCVKDITLILTDPILTTTPLSALHLFFILPIGTLAYPIACILSDACATVTELISLAVLNDLLSVLFTADYYHCCVL